MEKTRVSQKAIVLNLAGKILGIRRSSTAPSNANKWDLPGGDLDFGENPTEGILREIKEETGLSVTNIQVFDVWSDVDDLGDFWVTIAYTANSNSDEAVFSNEHSEFKWLTKEGFLELDSAVKVKFFVNNLD